MSDTIEGMGLLNNRARVVGLMPTLEEIIGAHREYLLAQGEKAEAAAKAKRNTLVASLTVDEVNTAKMFLASLGALVSRWA